MGRYARQFTGERRTAKFTFQLTPEEREELGRLADSAALKPAEFVRRRCLSGQPNAVTASRMPSEVGRKIAVELARVGNNLNQLAHHANATGAMPERVALDQTLEEIVKATEALIQL
jgi:hypothetical protein